MQLDTDHRRYRTASEAADALQGLALSPLTRSEGTLKLAAQRLACAPAAALPPDFSVALPPPPLRAGEHKARAADTLQSGQFQAVGTSALVAAVLANPKQLPLGKLIEKICEHQGRTGLSLSPPEVMWQQLESLRSQGYGAADLAEGWLELAQFYGQQVQQGHRSLINIVIAIAAYEQALSHTEAAPIAYDHLGRLYWILSRQEPKSRLRCLETAIRVYQRGASLAANRPANLGHKREITPATHPEIQQAIEPKIQPRIEPGINLALLHNHLGEALNDLAALTGQPDEWQQAIQAYETALTSLSLKTTMKSNAAGSNAAGCSNSSTEGIALEARLLGAEIQNNLGTACWNLAQHQPKDTAIELLQQAIAAYNQAAQLYDPDEDAIRYGMIQNNLGTTYLNLGQLEQSLDLLRLATGTYQVALIYRSRNEAPMSHAATQNNLGAACIQLAGHPYLDPIAAREALEQAIVAYKEALMLIKELSEVGVHNAGFDPAVSRLNLGLAHQRIGTLTEDIQATGIQLVYLETAIRCYVELFNQEPKGSEIYSLGLEYLNQIFEYLSNEVGLPLEHPLFKLLPNHLFRE
ncbi:MAG: tetratricopeptide repeat protein [Synechococcales cyanobacterium CRU_2_2]|nr:tetratricopeptide repeat protein [Synechococcales cyanobacterium CRU_2_2]